MLPILIAEDDRQLSRALDLYLGAFGFETAIHETMTAAKTAIESAPGYFAFALIDYQLGEDNGVDLAKWILDRESEIRLVLMSGYLPDGRIDLPSLGGRSAFLQKPFRPAEVISCLQELHPILLMSL